MRKLYRLCLVLVLFLSLVGSAYSATKVALVFDAGGKFDKSFNQSAWEGALKAKEELGITLKDAEPGDQSKIEEAIRTFAKENYDLVVTIGFANAPPLQKVAAEFPKVKFAVVDSQVDLPNVASLVFNEHEGSFLVGMIAAMRAKKLGADKKQTVGFIGGMDIPLIHKFEQGYVQGVKTINPKINVIINYVGNTPTAWNDPAKGKEIAKSQFAKGSSVIYHAAGGSGSGLFDAIKEQNGNKPCSYQSQKCVYAIGVDSNQNYLAPGQILTSMTKRVDVAVYNTIKAVNDGTFKGGLTIFGLADDGVGFSLDKHNKKLISKRMLKEIKKYKKKIISGELKVKSTR